MLTDEEFQKARARIAELGPQTKALESELQDFIRADALALKGVVDAESGRMKELISEALTQFPRGAPLYAQFQSLLTSFSNLDRHAATETAILANQAQQQPVEPAEE